MSLSGKNNPILRVAAKGVIVHQGKVLIVREASTYEEGTNIGRYSIPGGRINPGEAFMAGLHREIFEETGLKVKLLLPIFVGEWHPVIKGVPNQIIAIFYLCKPLTTKVCLSEEHDDYKWILPSEHKKYKVLSPENEVFKSSGDWMANKALV